MLVLDVVDRALSVILLKAEGLHLVVGCKGGGVVSFLEGVDHEGVDIGFLVLSFRSSRLARSFGLELDLGVVLLHSRAAFPRNLREKVPKVSHALVEL